MNDRSSINNYEVGAFNEALATSKSGGRSISRILREIVSHVTEIVRSEIQLARVEVSEDITQVTKALGFFVLGGVFAFHALGFVLFGLVYALGTRTSLWLSAVVVGAGAGVIAAVFLWIGRSRIRQASLKPDKTIRSLQENVTWTKKQAA